MKLSEIKLGQKVHFKPPYYYPDQYDNGIVKEIPDFATDRKAFVGFNCVRVVFHCNENWDKYESYTSELTHKDHLFPGWIGEEDGMENP